jgi:hypothetical protein
VTWRDGVHLTGTPIWCDVRRRRGVCFLSSADRVARSGHGQLIGTPITLAVLGTRTLGHLAVPLRQRFTLGTLRLELIPSGRGFGAAALHVDITGQTVLYAGVIRTSTGGVGDAAELRTCDAVVVAAPYGEPHHRFPPLSTEIDATIEWTRAQLARGGSPVLFVDSLLDGLEVASRLSAAGIPIAGGRPLREAGQRMAALVPGPQVLGGQIAIGSSITQRSAVASDPRGGAPRHVASFVEPASGIPAIDPTPLDFASLIAAPGREPRAIVWLDADRAGLARRLGERSFTTALVSARASAGTAGYDAGFVWAAAADRAQLLDWIDATSARNVFVTGACAEAIVAALGVRARVIGPPQQMPLFPHEAVP